jgi:hypothetical protein
VEAAVEQAEVIDEMVIQRTRHARFLCSNGTAHEGRHIELAWMSWQPLEVVLIMDIGNNNTEDWVFARDLLVEGGGDGDVQVHFNAVRAAIALDSSDGHAEIHIPTEVVSRFVRRTLRRMPLGQEPEIDDAEFQEDLDYVLAGDDES